MCIKPQGKAMCGRQKDGFQIEEKYIIAMIVEKISEHNPFRFSRFLNNCAEKGSTKVGPFLQTSIPSAKRPPRIPAEGCFLFFGRFFSMFTI